MCPYVDHNNATLTDSMTAMDQVFDNLNCYATAEAKLHSLWQGRRSVAEHIAEFWNLDLRYHLELSGAKESVPPAAH